MLLRILIVVQVAWVALISAVAREVLPGGRSLQWTEHVIRVTCLPTLIAFPVLVWLAVRRAVLPTWKRWAVVAIEVMLFFALLIALLPAVA